MRSSIFGSFLFLALFSVSAWSQENSLSTTIEDAGSSRSPWGVSYFSFSSADSQAVSNGTPSVSVYNYFSLNYKLNRDEKFSFRPAFSIETAGYDSKGVNSPMKTRLNDFYFNYANYSLGLLPGEWAFSGQYRIYLPTSESAQNKKTITQVGSWMILEKKFRRGWVVQYNMKPDLYVQSQKAYRSETERIFPDGSSQSRIEAKANQWGKYEHYMKFGRYLNSVFSPSLDLGFEHTWYHTSDQVSRGDAARNELKIAPNTEIRVTRELRFIFGIENSIGLDNTRIAGTWQKPDGQSINLFRPEDTQYYLMTFITL